MIRQHQKIQAEAVLICVYIFGAGSTDDRARGNREYGTGKYIQKIRKKESLIVS